MTSPGARVLVVEDESALATLVSAYLERAGYAVRTVGTGPAALTAVEEDQPDVIVLDLGLPGMDGVEVARRVRQVSDCYILMLTARTDELDRLVGLSVGADDYITKPFSPRELVARVQAVLRRPRAGAPASVSSAGAGNVSENVEIGGLSINADAREVSVAGERVVLTRTEFDLLLVLAENPGQVLTRPRLIVEVWDTTWVGDEHVVDVHIGNLRQKLARAGGAGLIDTIRGVGFRLGKP